MLKEAVKAHADAVEILEDYLPVRKRASLRIAWNQYYCGKDDEFRYELKAGIASAYKNKLKHLQPPNAEAAIKEEHRLIKIALERIDALLKFAE